MINIKCENIEEGTRLEMHLSGFGEDLVQEAVKIMEYLPIKLRETNESLYFHFLAELVNTEGFGVDIKPRNAEEDKDNGKQSE